MKKTVLLIACLSALFAANAASANQPAPDQASIDRSFQAMLTDQYELVPVAHGTLSSGINQVSDTPSVPHAKAKSNLDASFQAMLTDQRDLVPVPHGTLAAGINQVSDTATVPHGK